MTPKDRQYYAERNDKIQRLLEDAEQLMATADSYAERGDKEQVRSYLIKAGQKNKEAFDMAREDIKQLMSEMPNYEDRR
ncbi:MAG: hypothetical protein IJ435_01045 [Clostridia bacterium]|nr:hypothetical protein [Clostridia bacterium]